MQYNVGDVISYRLNEVLTHGIVQELEEEVLYVTTGVTSNYITKVEVDKVCDVIKKRESIYITYNDIGEICTYICNNKKRIGEILAIDVVHKLCLVKSEKSMTRVDFENIIEMIGRRE